MKYAFMTLITISFVVIVSVSPAQSGDSPTVDKADYAWTLDKEVLQAYDQWAPASQFQNGIIKECVVDRGAPNRPVAIVLSLNKASGAHDVSAYQWVQTAGWTVDWIDHRAVGDFKPYSRALVAWLKKSCGRWS